LAPLEDLVRVRRGAMVSLNQVCSVAHQPAGLHKLLELIDGGHAVLGRELNDTLSVLESEETREHDENIQARLACGLECAGQGLEVARLKDLELQPPRSGGHLCCQVSQIPRAARRVIRCPC
jgi:hypothetical protein